MQTILACGLDFPVYTTFIHDDNKLEQNTTLAYGTVHIHDTMHKLD